MREFKDQIIERFDRALRTTHMIVVPIVHYGGDSKTRLLEYRQAVIDPLRLALEKMSDVSPNMRNYYIAPPELDLWDKALAQHQRRARALHEVLEDLEYEYAAIEEDTFNGDR